MSQRIPAKQLEGVLRQDGTAPFLADQNANGFKVTNLAAPVAANDAVNKAYADALAQGLKVLQGGAKALATSNVAITGAPAPIDGVTINNGDTVLLTAQTNPVQNGPWVVNTGGAWARPVSLPNGSSAAGLFVYINQGTTYGNTGWVCTADPPADVVGTDALPFTQFSGTGFSQAGNGLAQTGNTLSVQPANGSIVVGPSGTQVGYGTPVAVGAANNAGAAATAARSDHGHEVTAIVESSGPTPLAIGAIAAGQYLARVGGVVQGVSAPADSTPTTANKEMTASVTVADGDLACATALASTPASTSYVQVIVNGVSVSVATAAAQKTTRACYFSGDGGVTARNMGAGGNIASGDLLYWNGSIAGYQLDATDRISFNYVA
jgi:hypothetical protein